MLAGTCCFQGTTFALLGTGNWEAKPFQHLGAEKCPKSGESKTFCHRKHCTFQGSQWCCRARYLGKVFLRFWLQHTWQFIVKYCHIMLSNYFPFCFTAQPLASQHPHCIHTNWHTDSYFELSKQLPWWMNLSREDALSTQRNYITEQNLTLANII